MELIVKALNPDHALERAHVANLFAELGATYCYHPVLANPATWRRLGDRETTCLVANDEQGRTIAHLGVRSNGPDRCAAFPLCAPRDAEALGLLLAQAQRSAHRVGARSLSLLTPAAEHMTKVAQAAGLLPATDPFGTSGEGQIQLFVARRAQRAEKALAVFIPANCADEAREIYDVLGLNRKTKGTEDAASWALPADLPGLSYLSRGRSVAAVSPSLLDSASRALLVGGTMASALLVNAFDPQGIPFGDQLLAHGYEFSGVVPFLQGIDYVVYSRITARVPRTVNATLGARSTR